MASAATQVNVQAVAKGGSRCESRGCKGYGRLLPEASDGSCVLNNKISWKGEPEKVIVLYVKFIYTIISDILEYYGTREIL